MATLTKEQDDAIIAIANERVKDDKKKAIISAANAQRSLKLDEVRAIDEKLKSDLEKV
jgi:hypothetical protein